MKKLKNCPFCGQDCEIQYAGYDPIKQTPFVFISCSGCFASSFNYFQTKKDAIEAWNKRINDN